MRLKLKIAGAIALIIARRKGAGISFEIETVENVSAGIVDDLVARARGSRLRLKHLDSEEIEKLTRSRKGAGISFEIETQLGDLRRREAHHGRKGAGISFEIETSCSITRLPHFSSSQGRGDLV